MNKPWVVNGILYSALDKLITFLCKYVCVVELLKILFVKFGIPSKKSKDYVKTRFAVDIFIIFKWILVSVFWIFSVKSIIVTIIVWYLLITNVLSHFYHHLWIRNLLIDHHNNLDRMRRRFLTLSLAISFSFFGFAYLYAVPYFDFFQWEEGTIIFWDSIFYSISNSLTMSFGSVVPIYSVGHTVSAVQLLIMFIFFSVLLSVSIPQFNTIEKEKENGIQK